MRTDRLNAGSPLPARLSLLGVFILFNMVFADVLCDRRHQPGGHRGEGEEGGVHVGAHQAGVQPPGAGAVPACRSRMEAAGSIAGVGTAGSSSLSGSAPASSARVMTRA